MNILHYTLGLPPLRSGGLIKYSTDLLLSQRDTEHNIALLYPGGINIKYPDKDIVGNKNWKDISLFEIKNPAIVPLLLGIKNPRNILDSKEISEKCLEKFFQKFKPDIFHIHTLMGLPIELVHFFKKKNVRIIYTSHDYFGLCIKVNFINQDNVICQGANPQSCALCNYHSPSRPYLRLRNSKLLLNLKNIPLTKYLKKYRFENQRTRDKINISEKEIFEYGLLIDFYKEIFASVDYFHFNSQLTQEMYSHCINIENSKVIPISHSGIEDNRVLKKFDTSNIRLTFIGNLSSYKGFPLLKEILRSLNDKSISNWTLNVWGSAIGQDIDCNQISYRGTYSQNQLKEVFNETDLLIVPSLWKETFSLITMEALSYGVPVLLSSNVGAKHFVKEYKPDFIYNSQEELYSILKKILSNTKLLEDYNKVIIKLPWKCSFDEHVKQILYLYKELLSRNENSIY